MADAPHKTDDGGQSHISAAAAPVQASAPPVPKVIVVIATGWGPLYGGINSFSFDFCLALGRLLRGSARVVCLTTNVDALTCARAKSDHIDIYTLAKVGPGDEHKVAREACELLGHSGITAIDLVFGHDVVTGPAAIELALLMGGKAALFHHMSYIQYQGLKKDGRTAIQMDTDQKVALCRAAYVIAVGPLLKDSAQRLCQRDVPMVVPGMATIQPATHRVKGDFRAITFGRMGGDDDPIKQGSLAVAGYGRYVKQAHEKRVDRTHGFTIYGLSQAEYEAEEQAIKEQMRKEAARHIPVNATVYTNDRQELFTALANNEVALMLSWHEGFGLTGWEAIAAGVPLVVSKQTGLYMLLDAPGDLGGAANVSVVDVRGYDGGVPDDADVGDVADALFQISANWEKFHQKAITLRDHLAKKYTWEGCASAALNACEFPFVAADPETASPPEGSTKAPSATHSKIGFLVLVGLLLLAAVIPAVLVLPQAFGPGSGPEQGGADSKSNGNSGPPAPEVKKEPPAPLKRLQPETITCYLGDGVEEKRALFPLKCAGGHADGRIQLIPAQPADLKRAGSTLMWVASCSAFHHLPPDDKKPKPPPKPDGPAIRFVYVPADKHRVEVEGVSVYELRATGGAADLVYVGKVELNAYKELVEKGVVTVNSKPEKVLYLRTGPGHHRRVEVSAVKCADGPAAKKYLPVLLDPEKAVASGSTLWPVLDLEPRPPDRPGLISRRDSNAPSHVAHLSWYRLVRSEGGAFEARCVFHPNAEEYVAKHRFPLTQKIPLLLKELETLKRQMSEDIAFVRKDYAGKKIHPGSAKMGEERYASVLAKHNVTIEHLIETLSGTNTFGANYDTQRMLREEDMVIDAFLAWYDQRDLPPDVQIKTRGYHGRMEKLRRFVETNRDMSSEYSALDDEGKRALRMRLRAMAYEPWPISGD